MKVTQLIGAITLVLMLIGGCRELSTSQPACTAEPVGTVFAAIEGEASTDAMLITGVVESITPRGEGYHDRIVVASGERRYTVLFSAPDRSLPVEVSQPYTFEIQHQPGFPTACSIIVSDDKGTLFVGVSDWSLGVNVSAPKEFELEVGPSECESRPHNACFESITNSPLTVSSGGDSVTLFNGETGKLPGYVATCLACQDIVYTSNCADAGINGVSYVIERAAVGQ